MLKLFIVNESKGLYTLGNIRTTILLILILLISCWIISIRHPVRMAGLLILMALAGSIFLGKLVIRWVLYLLALVFLGGVIVVLLFIVSVCANEKFFFKVKRNAAPAVLVWLLRRVLVSKISILREGLSGIGTPLVLYQRDGLFRFILFILILVLCILSVVKISKLESGPIVKRL